MCNIQLAHLLMPVCCTRCAQLPVLQCSLLWTGGREGHEGRHSQQLHPGFQQGVFKQRQEKPAQSIALKLGAHGKHRQLCHIRPQHPENACTGSLPSSLP